MKEIKKKLKVLIVDDMVDNIDIIRNHLSPQYAVTVSRSGEKALRMAGSDNPPDLILLDIIMPDLDGFTVCRRLKSNPGTRDIPIIFLTVKDSPEDVVKGFELGAVDYVTKPFNAAELTSRVDTHLLLRKTIRELETALQQIKTLSGLIPICANCKKIRNDDGYWEMIEQYVQDRSNAVFSHGICPGCARILYPKNLAGNR